jgi:hypothetical protein
MKRTWKPTAAGIMNIVTGATTIVYVAGAGIGW